MKGEALLAMHSATNPVICDTAAEGIRYFAGRVRSADIALWRLQDRLRQAHQSLASYIRQTREFMRR